MSVYGPKDDSYFLKEFVEQKNLEDKQVLDMGTGTGIIAIKAAGKGDEVTAADKNPEALGKAKKNAGKEEFGSIEFVETDLFNAIEGEFDYIFFNPPYLSGNRLSDSDALVGGDKGTEIIQAFLEEVGDYLSSGGEAYVIGSSRSEIEDLKTSYALEQVDSKNLWFERLYLFRFRA